MQKTAKSPVDFDSERKVLLQAHVKKKVADYIQGEADVKHEGKPAPVIRAMLGESYEARTGQKA